MIYVDVDITQFSLLNAPLPPFVVVRASAPPPRSTYLRFCLLFLPHFTLTSFYPVLSVDVMLLNLRIWLSYTVKSNGL